MTINYIGAFSLIIIGLAIIVLKKNLIKKRKLSFVLCVW